MKSGRRDHLCFELRHQSRRPTNSDLILVTEEGDELPAHQAVLSLHSRLLRTLFQKNRTDDVPKLIFCDVSKKELDALISLLYCGEVSLDRCRAENLTELLRRLDVDTKNLSFPGFLARSDFHLPKIKKYEHGDCEEEVKLEADSAEEIQNFIEEDLDHDDEDINVFEEVSVDCSAEESIDKITSDNNVKPKMKICVWGENDSGVRMGGVRKSDWKKKMEEEIEQGTRYKSGKRKLPHKKKLIPQKARKGKFMCPECGIVLTMQRTLKKHIDSIHRGIRYPCEQCPYQAKTKLQLKHHIEAVHEGTRYYCDQCEFISLTKNNLRQHVNYKHCDLKNYHCDQCDFKAKDAGTVKKHVNSVHLKIKLTCPDCGSKHSQQSGLIKHRKLKHGYVPDERITHRKLAMASQM